MADEKAKPKSEGTNYGPFSKDHYKEVIYVVLPGLLILSLLLERFLAYLNGLEVSASPLGLIAEWFSRFWSLWKPLAIILSIAGVGLAIYSSFKLKEIKKEEERIFGVMPKDEIDTVTEEDVKKENQRWLKVLSHAHSENPAEWRLAILEADIMLEEMLKALNYQGDGIGEMLKTVDPTDMLSLDQAWEAHKVRNRIAHSGQDFDLTQRETQRVVGLFQNVFEEFDWI